MVYGSGLENQRGCKPTVSSNLTLSAFKPSRLLGFMPDRILRAAALLQIGACCGQNVSMAPLDTRNFRCD